jgi:hypothetical protein
MRGARSSQLGITTHHAGSAHGGLPSQKQKEQNPCPHRRLVVQQTSKKETTGDP